MPFLSAERHAQLLAEGYRYEHVEAYLAENGDPESGPSLDYDPPWDMYEAADHRIFVAEDGKEVREPRDLAFEAYIESMAGGSCDN